MIQTNTSPSEKEIFKRAFKKRTHNATSINQFRYNNVQFSRQKFNVLT